MNASGKYFGDPLFQLNLVLWALVPNASAVSNPILANAGYILNSVNASISPGPSLQAIFKERTASVSGPAPDVIAESVSQNPWLLFECKRSGFSAGSSTASQAKKLIAIKSAFLEAFASPRSAKETVVAYITRDEKLAEFAEALAEISAEFEGLCETCSYAIAYVAQFADGVGLKPYTEASGSNILAHVLGDGATILRCEDGDDPRPLYFIPFDPSIDYNEHTIGTREEAIEDLLTRATMACVSTIGRERPPSRVVIDLEDALAKATFGLINYWRDRKQVAFMRDLLSRHIRRQLEGVKPPAKVQESGPNLVLTVADEKEKNTLVDQLTASVEDVVDLESERLQQPLPFSNA